jgi:hypothetical protein
MATPVRHLRIPDEEWAAWREAAASEDCSIATWVRRRCSVGGVIIDSRSGAVIARVVPDDELECKHPKKARDVKGYATFCSKELGGCGARL